MLNDEIVVASNADGMITCHPVALGDGEKFSEH